MLGWLKRTPVVTLTPRDAYERHRTGEIALIDVREPGEWRQMRIPGAINVPLSRLPQSLDTLPRDRKIVLYCLSGARSASAFQHCQKSGVPVEAHIGGGITAWRLAGLPLEQ